MPTNYWPLNSLENTMCALIFVSLYISKNLIDEHLLPKDIRHMGSLRALERSKASLSPPMASAAAKVAQ